MVSVSSGLSHRNCRTSRRCSRPVEIIGFSPVLLLGTTNCLLPSTACRRFVGRFGCYYPFRSSLRNGAPETNNKPQVGLSPLSILAHFAQFCLFFCFRRNFAVGRGACTRKAAKPRAKLFRRRSQIDLKHAGLPSGSRHGGDLYALFSPGRIAPDALFSPIVLKAGLIAPPIASGTSPCKCGLECLLVPLGIAGAKLLLSPRAAKQHWIDFDSSTFF